MTGLQTQLPTNEWVTATWDEFVAIADDIFSETSKCYYDRGQLRIELMSTGSKHSRGNTIIILAVNLFCSIKGIPVNGLANCSYRKTGIQECQPDISYYIGERAQLAPNETSVVDLDCHPLPDLAIEISDTTLADDLSKKLNLYERLRVAEYWVVDVQNNRVIAFSIASGNSEEISQSLVLPGLEIVLLASALQRSQQVDQSQIITWLLSQFSGV